MDIRGKTYRVELIVSNFIENFIGIALTGTTVWGNDREGSLRSLSYQWLVPFRSCCHLMAYRTSRVWYPARVPAKHVGSAYHHKKRKNRQKNIEKVVLDCYYAGLFLSSHCPFTDQRCLGIRCDNGLFFGKRSRLLLYGVTGLYHSLSSVLITVRDGARHPRGIYLLLSCAAEF